jgi:hypothetical protein
MYENIPFMPQQADMMGQQKFSLQGARSPTSATLLNTQRNALLQRQLEEDKKRGQQQMYMDIAKMVFSAAGQGAGIAGGAGAFGGGGAPSPTSQAGQMNNAARMF